MQYNQESAEHEYYFKRVIAELVHLRGIENFDDLRVSEILKLNKSFLEYLDLLIKEEQIRSSKSIFRNGGNHEIGI